MEFRHSSGTFTASLHSFSAGLVSLINSEASMIKFFLCGKNHMIFALQTSLPCSSHQSKLGRDFPHSSLFFHLFFSCSKSTTSCLQFVRISGPGSCCNLGFGKLCQQLKCRNNCDAEGHQNRCLFEKKGPKSP